MQTGSAETRLIVLRGNSASGKTATAHGIRARFGRGIAIVGQDVIRRDMLRERDETGAANIGLIDVTARYALDYGFHVIVEGILHEARYGKMLRQLTADHRGTTLVYYFDIPFEETVRRHATKPQAREYGQQEMRAWFQANDVLRAPGFDDIVIPASLRLDDTIERIMRDARLEQVPGGGG